MKADALARAWQAQSLLVGYPDEQLYARLGLLDRVAATLDDPVGGPLRRLVAHLARTAPARAAADYVATFDHRKRCCLFLTYYAHGDTRKRGMALLRLKQTYAAAGLRLVDDELPDHLAVLLEYAATDPRQGRALLAEHRAAIELLRLALRDAESPWAGVLDSVSATLPPLGADLRAAVARLAAEGPPEEQVGLAPFAPPEYMPDPRLTPQGASR
ncbi:respiratory nitrate reductase chaperone NarJ [Krasilnikovia cinnamomea]|uniref:Respiratory nitrate reductase chaperone NarJ n=1 Tax=Krasilnikovia cinnamomea TaxID=349313 RepID=A0A4Q7ZV11_9ACTN|nr:nitrate reductase molybdenum cofactor assembly chaperone [Krasilnikovia cinnamomea]RZU54439.1 respiratory nitrate reductase chaperone NarJ [Krasilnikovia cinnamomea]